MDNNFGRNKKLDAEGLKLISLPGQNEPILRAVVPFWLAEGVLPPP